METFADAVELLGGLDSAAEGSASAQLVPLLVLTGSLAGLAWLACKRPAAFVEQICPRLALLLSVLLLGGLAWNAAGLGPGIPLSNTGLILAFGGGASYFFFLYRFLHRFAVEFERSALAQVARGSAAARKSHRAVGTRSSLH